jgi:Fic family protein
VTTIGNPLLCDPSEKAALETANGVEQLDFIAHLVNEYKLTDVRESHVLELQRLAVQGLYPCAGSYRTPTRDVVIEGSGHTVPEPALVPGLVREALDYVNHRPNGSGLHRAAFALWRFNWIHPFSGGNGRTSRALTYLILCIDVGGVLPGVPTVPTLIYESRDEYVRALRVADAGVRDKGEPDLSAMVTHLGNVVTTQLASALKKLGC